MTQKISQKLLSELEHIAGRPLERRQLVATLEKSIEAFEDAQHLQDYDRQASRSNAKFDDIKKHLLEAIESWKRLGSFEQRKVAIHAHYEHLKLLDGDDFIDLSSEYPRIRVEDLFVHLGNRLQAYVLLLNDVADTHPSPGKGRPKQNSGLEAYYWQLRKFWDANMDTGFTPNFQTTMGHERTSSDEPVLKPENRASRFFCKCASLLGPHGSHDKCRSVMQKLMNKPLV